MNWLLMYICLQQYDHQMVSRLMSLIGKPMADSNRPGFRMKRFVTKYFMLPFLAIEQIFRLQEGIVSSNFCMLSKWGFHYTERGYIISFD